MNFELEGCDNVIEYDEGLFAFAIPITLHYRRNENPFTVTLTPTSIDQVEAKGLGFMVNSMTISAGSRAIPGKKYYTEHWVKFPPSCEVLFC